MNKNSKRVDTLLKNNIVDINTHALIFNVFYSLRLNELNCIFNLKFGNVVSARIAFIILNHFCSYQRNIKNDLCRLYNIRSQTASPILNDFVTNGYLIEVNSKRRTNLGIYAPFKAYQITQRGKCIAEKIKMLIELKISGIN